MFKLASASVLAAALFTLTGCQTSDPVRAPYTPNQDLLTHNTYPKITISGDLMGWLMVDQPTISQDPILHVSVPVRSVTSTGQWMKVQWRYIFLDANNVPVKAQPDWVPVTLEPRQQVFMTGNALDTNAVDWRLEIRTQR
jgi:uncharacterized protein YcfL